jgi:hypothetical protein
MSRSTTSSRAQALASKYSAQGPGWFWWTFQRACLPDGVPIGPFESGYLAYRDFYAL